MFICADCDLHCISIHAVCIFRLIYGYVSCGVVGSLRSYPPPVYRISRGTRAALRSAYLRSRNLSVYLPQSQNADAHNGRVRVCVSEHVHRRSPQLYAMYQQAQRINSTRALVVQGPHSSLGSKVTWRRRRAREKIIPAPTLFPLRTHT